MIPCAHKIFSSDTLSAYVVALGQLRTNCGMILNHIEKAFILIDCPFGAYDFCNNFIPSDYSPRAAIVTHSHWDHIGDIHFFKNSGAKIYCPIDDVIVIENPNILKSFVGHSYGLTPSNVDVKLHENDVIKEIGLTINTSHIQGHNPGSSSYYIPQIKTVFTGDTLFAGCIGRFDFFGGDEQTLKINIRNKILTLPEETQVIPGHGKFSTVKIEKNSNQFLQ